MRTTGKRDVLTTGEVARICSVAPRTVTKWFDTGKLRGYRIPGSRDRRIPRSQLIAFMRAHRLPLERLDGGLCRVLLLAARAPEGLAEAMNATGRYEVHQAAGAFEAGMVAQRIRPHAVVVDAADEREALAFCRCVKQAEDFQAIALALVAPLDEQRAQRLVAGGFDGWLAAPPTPAALAAAIERATNIVT